MKSYSETSMKEVRAAFERTVLGWPGVTKKTMFGCPSYQAEGELFAFLVDRGLVLTRLDEADRTNLARRLHGGPFASGERTVAHWIRIPLAERTALRPLWPAVRRSYAAAARNR